MAEDIVEEFFREKNAEKRLAQEKARLARTDYVLATETALKSVGPKREVSLLNFRDTDTNVENSSTTFHTSTQHLRLEGSPKFKRRWRRHKNADLRKIASIDHHLVRDEPLARKHQSESNDAQGGKPLLEKRPALAQGNESIVQSELLQSELERNRQERENAILSYYESVDNAAARVVRRLKKLDHVDGWQTFGDASSDSGDLDSGDDDRAKDLALVSFWTDDDEMERKSLRESTGKLLDAIRAGDCVQNWTHVHQWVLRRAKDATREEKQYKHLEHESETLKSNIQKSADMVGQILLDKEFAIRRTLKRYQGGLEELSARERQLKLAREEELEKALQTKLFNLEADKPPLQAQVAMLRSKILDIEGAIRKADETLGERGVENRLKSLEVRFAQKSRRLIKSIEEAHIQVCGLERELEVSNLRIRALENELGKETVLDRVAKTNPHLEKRMREIQSKKAKASKLLEHARAEANQAQKEKEEDEKRLRRRAARARKKKKRLDYEKRQEERAQAREIALRDKAKLELRLHQEREDFEREETLEKERNEALHQEHATLSEEIAQLHQELNAIKSPVEREMELMNQIKTLKSSLASLERAFNVDAEELERRNIRIVEKRESIRMNLAQLERVTAIMREKESSVDETKAQKASLEQKLERFRNMATLHGPTGPVGPLGDKGNLNASVLGNNPNLTPELRTSPMRGFGDKQEQKSNRNPKAKYENATERTMKTRKGDDSGVDVDSFLAELQEDKRIQHNHPSARGVILNAISNTTNTTANDAVPDIQSSKHETAFSTHEHYGTQEPSTEGLQQIQKYLRDVDTMIKLIVEVYGPSGDGDKDNRTVEMVARCEMIGDILQREEGASIEEEMELLERDCKDMELTVNNLHSDLHHERLALEELRRDASDRTGRERAAIQKRLVELTKELHDSKLALEIAVLEREACQQESKSHAMRVLGNLETEVAEIPHQMRKLETRLERLESEIESAAQKREQAEDLLRRRQLEQSKLHNEFSHLSEDLARNRESDAKQRMKQTKQKIRTLERENKALNRNIRTLKTCIKHQQNRKSAEENEAKTTKRSEKRTMRNLTPKQVTRQVLDEAIEYRENLKREIAQVFRTLTHYRKQWEKTKLKHHVKKAGHDGAKPLASPIVYAGSSSETFREWVQASSLENYVDGKTRQRQENIFVSYSSNAFADVQASYLDARKMLERQINQTTVHRACIELGIEGNTAISKPSDEFTAAASDATNTEHSPPYANLSASVFNATFGLQQGFKLETAGPETHLAAKRFGQAQQKVLRTVSLGLEGESEFRRTPNVRSKKRNRLEPSHRRTKFSYREILEEQRRQQNELVESRSRKEDRRIARLLETSTAVVRVGVERPETSFIPRVHVEENRTRALISPRRDVDGTDEGARDLYQPLPPVSKLVESTNEKDNERRPSLRTWKARALDEDWNHPLAFPRFSTPEKSNVASRSPIRPESDREKFKTVSPRYKPMDASALDTLARIQNTVMRR